MGFKKRPQIKPIDSRPPKIVNRVVDVRLHHVSHSMHQTNIEKQKFYFKRPIMLIFFIIILGLLSALAYYAIKQRQTPQLIGVHQTEIDAQSTLSRNLGASLSNLDADKTLNLIIYYDGYQNEAIAKHYVGIIQATLRQTEPFKSANNLEVKVQTSSKQQCKVEKTVKSILKCDHALIGQLNELKIPHFKLLVLSPLEFVPYATLAHGKNSAFYLSTYKGALTDAEIESFISMYFLHEFGHSLGLRDEYARARYDKNGDVDLDLSQQNTGSKAYIASRPNCAPDRLTAEQWWGSYVAAGVAGYNQGCGGNKDYYYPSKNTVMGDDPTDATYGRVSEDYLRAALTCFYGQEKEVNYPNDYVQINSAPKDCADFTKLYPNFWEQ